MKYFLNVFSPLTYEKFSNSAKDVAGFSERHRKAAGRVNIGDKLLCYMTKLSRWVGVLEVQSEPFTDNTPRFVEADDPYVLRFQVRPIVWLPKDQTVPIREGDVWGSLSFTKDVSSETPYWTGKLRTPLIEIDQADGSFLERRLLAQVEGGKSFPIPNKEWEKHCGLQVRREDKVVQVVVPEPEDDAPTIRESTQIQATLAQIGSAMSMRIWIPRNDRTAVLAEWKGDHEPILDTLPLNYDETTLKTIEQIDVLWLRKRSIIRAFEVEHTTSIYSGLLRMADLLALQPNMDIRLHIVAPSERREKVFQEVLRPVFSLLERGPLSECCTFLSYDTVRALAQDKNLAYLSDRVLDEYAEEAE